MKFTLNCGKVLKEDHSKMKTDFMKEIIHYLGKSIQNFSEIKLNESFLHK